VEEHCPGRDRQCVREQRRDTCGRKRAATLEAELERDEGEAVADQHGCDEGRRSAAGDSGLRGHVSRGVEHPRCEPEARAARKPPGSEAGHGQRCGHPDRDRDGGTVAASRCLAGEGGAEERKARDGRGDARPLASRERRGSRPLDEQREQADPARRGGLHERERRKRQRRDVQGPAAEPDDEAREPAPAREEQVERTERPADRQRRQRRGRAVLGEEAPVERGRRPKGKGQSARHGGAHFRSRVKGR
jgi:hypothetical protein